MEWNKMSGFVLLIKDENGQASYINKVFDNPEQCFEFAKLHNISQENYQIVTQEEFSSFMAEQQAQQRQGGYQQRVHIIDDQREPQQEIARPPKPVFMRNYRPAFVTFPMVGKKRRG